VILALKLQKVKDMTLGMNRDMQQQKRKRASMPEKEEVRYCALGCGRIIEKNQFVCSCQLEDENGKCECDQKKEEVTKSCENCKIRSLIFESCFFRSCRAMDEDKSPCLNWEERK